MLAYRISHLTFILYPIEVFLQGRTVIVVFPHLSKGPSLLQDLLKFLSICSEKKIDRVGSVYYTRIPPVTLMSILFSNSTPQSTRPALKHLLSQCSPGLIGQEFTYSFATENTAVCAFVVALCYTTYQS